MADSPISLRHLVLHPKPLSELLQLRDDEQFAADLLTEGQAVLDSPAWHSPKQWHENTRAATVTHTLPDEAWTMRRGASEGSAAAETKAPPKKKKGFWGGGGEPAREDEGIQWHRRITRLTGDAASYEGLWTALGERHCEQEIEYVPTLAKVLPVEDDGECPVDWLGGSSGSSGFGITRWDTVSCAPANLSRSLQYG